MPLNNFNPKHQGLQKSRLKKRVLKFQKLLKALSEREITALALQAINVEIDKVNQAESETKLSKQLQKSFRKILIISEKELNLVVKDHYRNMWLAIGMSAFGIPLGVAFGAALNNYAFIGLGIPIGFGIGIAIGSKKDKEAFEEGRQLNVEM
ncbi:hypothetical protein QYS49_30720 [Marivirga salinae]|uniref:Glycine zipper family protein n=1 Tax=Marivirga salinarum TaxID=3059078 RepID=A0AA49JBH6_9BACT|nr:hypothetical protein [Marivirga sp. BDSF4-3]WKK75763.2 hypothetical protein QYS49_30720 [Marivirga sp. BDSF4-3]